MASVTDTAGTDSLYEAGPRIYPRSQRGHFARLRWLMVWITQMVFYGVPWLQWNGRQAVLFDIDARRFSLFGLVLWPQDFILLTGLLVGSALTLFLFTTVAGRLWCGYACPQTVYTSIFLWIERMTEGEWSQRRRRDDGARSMDWWRRKILKHGVWILFAAWTGFTFVGYFMPIRSLAGAMASLQLGPWATFWTLFYAFATYGNAGWMREQVCKYMCPYARFQGVMMDAGTMTVTYDHARGEPRGGRSRSRAAVDHGLGDCVDCHRCVQVCPNGIDIRGGLQIDCINCGLCADACNDIMTRLGYQPGLIRYTSQERLLSGSAPVAAAASARAHHRRLALYGGLLLLVVGALATALIVRMPVRLDVMRDRSVLARETPDGHIENVYRLQILNMAERPRTFLVSARGIDGLTVGPSGRSATVPSLGSATLAVDLDADPGRLNQTHQTIVIEVQAADDPHVHVSSETRFFAR